MRKLAAVLCAAGLLLAASQLPASAQLAERTIQIQDTQDTASNSMGLAPYQLLTDYDMFFNPASTLDTGSVYGEVLQGNTWGGAAFKLPAGRMGLFANRPLARSNVGFAQTMTGVSLDPDLTIGLADARLTPGNLAGPVTGTPLPHDEDNNGVVDSYDLRSRMYNQRFDALYALPLGDTAGFGVRFSFLRISDGDPYVNNTGAIPGTVSVSRLNQELQFAVGGRWKGDGVVERLDGVVDISKPTLDNTFSTVSGTDRNDINLKDDSALNFGLGVRGVWKGWEDNKVVTTGRFSRVNTTSMLTEQIDLDTSVAGFAGGTDRDFKYDDKGSIFSADAVLHTEPYEALKVYYGAGIEARDFTRDITRTDRLASSVQADARPEKTFRVPLNLAFQHQTFRKLVTRFGVAHNLINNRDVDEIDRATGGAVDTQRQAVQGSLGNTAVSFGIGIVPMEKAVIDLGVTTGTLGAGLSTANLIGRGTLKYSF